MWAIAIDFSNYYITLFFFKPDKYDIFRARRPTCISSYCPQITLEDTVSSGSCRKKPYPITAR